MHQSPKLVSIRRTRNLSPLRYRRLISSSADWLRSREPPADDVTILDRIVVSLFRCSSRRLNVWVETSHIEYINFSTSKLPSEVAKAMEVNSSILVSLSRNDALPSKC